MDFRHLLQRPNFKRDLYIALTAPAISILAANLIANLISTATYTGIPPPPRIYRAPAQLPVPIETDLPYPPDALPGGRNIATPYGNTRVYEWGPSTGRKILFIHGISTPCIALAKIANSLVNTGGCRVMLFDLFGRGYSDCPDPRFYRQDISLFASQILAVLASSELDWKGFTLVGYSLGGGIAAAFTSYFPEVVGSLVLLAPGGLLRPTSVSVNSKLLYSGLLPDWIVHRIVGGKLRGAGEVKAKPTGGKIDVTSAAAAELPDGNSAHGHDSCSPIFEDRPHVSAATAVSWQVRNHPGFIPAFVSSVRYAPIHDEYERWRLIGERCEAKDGLREGKVLLILAAQDRIISSGEIAEDATTALGKENIEIQRLEGDHDFAIVNAEGCANAMMEFWAGAA